ncbi:MAG TPA: flavodoxin family protein [Methanocorpusculum sp.]|nr:flavodoxin family protein [Methanocorpusculum sp.]
MADVILISGSPRAGGNTEYALNVCKTELEAQGLTAEIVSLRGKEIKGCIACGQCGKLGCCSLKDDLNDLLPKIREAKGFIVGAPVYFGTARGDVMNMLQRVSMVARTNGNWLAGKIGGPVVVARRGGLTSTLQEMLMSFFISGMTVCGSDYWNIAFGKDKGEVAGDAEGMQTLRTFAANVANLIKKVY